MLLLHRVDKEVFNFLKRGKVKQFSGLERGINIIVSEIMPLIAKTLPGIKPNDVFYIDLFNLFSALTILLRSIKGVF